VDVDGDETDGHGGGIVKLVVMEIASEQAANKSQSIMSILFSQNASRQFNKADTQAPSVSGLLSAWHDRNTDKSRQF